MSCSLIILILRITENHDIKQFLTELNHDTKTELISIADYNLVMITKMKVRMKMRIKISLTFIPVHLIEFNSIEFNSIEFK